MSRDLVRASECSLDRLCMGDCLELFNGIRVEGKISAQGMRRMERNLHERIIGFLILLPGTHVPGPVV